MRERKKGHNRGTEFVKRKRETAHRKVSETERKEEKWRLQWLAHMKMTG